MPIFDQGYQHWQGHLSGHAWRWLTVARHGVRAQMKNRWARMVALFALVPALALGVFLAVWGLIEQKSSLAAPFLPMFQGLLPAAALEGPKAFRVAVWTIAYQFFFSIEMTFSMILVLLVGPSLVSQDLRFNAIPLYFSRPLRRFDYFTGKLGVVAFFLGMVAIIPTLVAYVLGLSFSLDFGVAWETARVVGAATLYGVLIVVSAGTLMLAISSLSRNSRYVMVIWFGFWSISYWSAAGLVAGVQQDWCYLVSYTGNLQRLGNALIGTPKAWDQIADAFEEGMSHVPRGMMGASRRAAIQEQRALEQQRMVQAHGDPDFAPAPSRNPRPRGQPDSETKGIRAMAGPQYPWYWSAAVLLGLFGISVWILSARVRSLDRLR